MNLEKHVVYMRRDAYRNFVGKVEGTKSLVRSWRRWEENIEIGLYEWRGLD
jgi:hypothetical protein